MIRICLVRMTDALTDEQCYAFAADAQLEITTNFAPHWANALISYIKPGDMIPGGAVQIHLEDTAPADDKGDLGYHTTEDGWPVGHCFYQDCKRDGCDFWVTVDHECKETIADLDGAATVHMVDEQTGVTWEYALEVCDAVEDDQFAHVVGSHKFSDFVLPSYFHQGSRGPWSFGNNLPGPFSLADGGYAARREIAPQVKDWDQNMHSSRVTPRMLKRWYSRSYRRWNR